jgi:dolichol-phosphate mannosyltransferase
VLGELARADDRVVAIRLSRSFGVDAALSAGIAHAGGDTIATMGGPADPPEALLMLLDAVRAGHDVARVRAVATQPGGRRFPMLAELDEGTGPYMTVLTRKVADAYVALQESDRDFRLTLGWLGFDVVRVDVGDLAAPEPDHAFRRLLTSGRIFQSAAAMRWIVYVGFAVAALGGAAALLFVILYLVAHPPRGWTSLAVLVTVLNGAFLISTGVIGLYLVKVMSQVRRRPLYVIDERVGDVERVGDEDAVPSPLAVRPPSGA